MQINRINLIAGKNTSFNGIVKDGEIQYDEVSRLHADKERYTSMPEVSKQNREDLACRFDMLNERSDYFDIMGHLPYYLIPGFIFIKAKNPKTHKSACIYQGDSYTYKDGYDKTYIITAKTETEKFITKDIAGKQKMSVRDGEMDPVAFIDATIDTLPELVIET